MKTNKDARRASEDHYGDGKARGRMHAPNKMKKNAKRSIYSDLEDDDVADYRSLIKKEDSILSYYDDPEEEEE